MFKKYHIDESHNEWDNGIDNWISVEIYRLMHDGKLPPRGDMSIDWVYKFLDKKSTEWWFKVVMPHKQFGSLYLTAKRMLYRHSDDILKEINEN